MAETTHLQLPLLAASQAQKHVTHNDALLRLDALAQIGVIDRDLTAPPGAPSDGDRYIVGSGATGAWSSWDLSIAWYVDGVWTKLTPEEGWLAWVADEDILLIWHGSAWVELVSYLVAKGGTREVLTAGRTYHVDPTSGSDSNDGLSSAAGAFATIAHAWDVVAALDLATYDVVIQLADDAYDENLVFDTAPVGGGQVIVRGNTTTPSNVDCAPSSGEFISIQVPVTMTVEGVKATPAGTSNWLAARDGAAHIFYGDIEFAGNGAGTGVHLRVDRGWVEASGDWEISGDVGAHIVLNTNGKFLAAARTVTLTGTPAWGSNFISASVSSLASFFSVTFSGSATGKRYAVSLNSVINTFGGGASALPGDVAGTTATGGQYA